MSPGSKTNLLKKENVFQAIYAIFAKTEAYIIVYGERKEPHSWFSIISRVLIPVCLGLVRFLGFDSSFLTPKLVMLWFLLRFLLPRVKRLLLQKPHLTLYSAFDMWSLAFCTAMQGSLVRCGASRTDFCTVAQDTTRATKPLLKAVNIVKTFKSYNFIMFSIKFNENEFSNLDLKHCFLMSLSLTKFWIFSVMILECFVYSSLEDTCTTELMTIKIHVSVKCTYSALRGVSWRELLYSWIKFWLHQPCKEASTTDLSVCL